ncbi:MAG: twin-arginine translocation signal domain-containing protein [Anaerolineae bacterium]|nr:twin-arginine translocation signal domain-containing protein [Anaerolineae bacterium]
MKEQPISRRELLKLLAAAGGAVAASTALPSEWTKPLVETGVLPAHAQTSEPIDIPDTLVGIQWNSGMELADLDLRGVGNGATVDENSPNSPTMAFSYEEVAGDYTEYTETIAIKSNLASGNYEISVFLEEWAARLAQQAPVITITLPDAAPEFKFLYNITSGNWLHCATIDMDTHAITWYV